MTFLRPPLLSVAFLLFLTLSSLIGTSSAASRKKTKKKTSSSAVVLTRELLNLCRGQQAISSKAEQKRLKWVVAASGESSVLLGSSPQHQAACWTLYEDKRSRAIGSESAYLQRYALAVLHFATTKSNTTAWDWPMAVDTTPEKANRHGDWMSAAHECTWYGVVCQRKVVRELQLGFMKLDGLVPREISLLTNLRDLDLHANDFQGIVPHKIVDALSNLEYLRLHMNGFFGALHEEIVGLKKLKELWLFGNYFGGTIPAELASLKNLEVIDFYAKYVSATSGCHGVLCF